MTTVLLLSIFWIVDGVLGLFGIQYVPEEYRGADFEREYKRCKGVGWLLVGIPMLIFWIVVHDMGIFDHMPYALAIAAIALPGMVYAFMAGRKYQKRFKK